MSTHSYRAALADKLLKYSFVEAIAGMKTDEWADFKALLQQALRGDGPSVPVVLNRYTARDGCMEQDSFGIWVRYQDAVNALRATHDEAKQSKEK